MGNCILFHTNTHQPKRRHRDSLLQFPLFLSNPSSKCHNYSIQIITLQFQGTAALLFPNEIYILIKLSISGNDEHGCGDFICEYIRTRALK